MNLFDKIIDSAHKDGVKFSFDADCMVKGCNKVGKWDQDITHPTEGKMTLELCDKHMDDFDKDISFEIVIKKESVQK